MLNFYSTIDERVEKLMKFKKDQKLIFLCSTRDFHAMDWVESYKKISGCEPTIFTESKSGEGLKDLSSNYNSVHNLFLIDFFLFSSQNKFSSIYRNILKILLIPLQVFILKIKINKLKLKKSIFHCHGMYYSLIAALSGINFISTPQGSEILIRYDSFFYKLFADFIFKRSLFITIDSSSMKKKINNNFQSKIYIIQFGVNIDIIESIKQSHKVKRKNAALSPRGMTSLYQIREITYAFNSLKNKLLSLDFCYPFADIDYLESVKKISKNKSFYYGQLERIELYKKFLEYKYVISIPSSDSSPRSVYEAVICGCIVIVQLNKYLLELPKTIRERIVSVDIQNPNWLKKGLTEALLCKPLGQLDYKTKNYLDQKYQMKKILTIINSIDE